MPVQELSHASVHVPVWLAAAYRKTRLAASGRDAGDQRGQYVPVAWWWQEEKHGAQLSTKQAFARHYSESLSCFVPSPGSSSGDVNTLRYDFDNDEVEEGGDHPRHEPVWDLDEDMFLYSNF